MTFSRPPSLTLTVSVVGFWGACCAQYGSADIWILSFGGGVPSKLILPVMVAFAFDMSNAGAPPGAPAPGGGGTFVSPPPPPQLATSATTRRKAQSTKDRLCMLGSPSLRLVICSKVEQINISHLTGFY